MNISIHPLLARCASIALVTVVSLAPPDPVAAADKVFEPKPPEEIAFNYPDPPSEGARDYFPISENAEARCVVVLASDVSSSLRAATSEFVKYLKSATGADIRMTDDSKEVADGLAAIHVGDTAIAGKIDLALPDLRYGDESFPNRRGFLVKSLDPKTLIIRGVDEDATGSGLVEFLKHYVGVRQYWFGNADSIGNVIPESPTLTIPQVEWRDWPYVPSLQMSLRSFGPRPHLDFYRRKAALPPGENYFRWLMPSKYVDEHPEYYALVNGKRLKPTDAMKNKGWQPCVSNPEVQQVMAENVKQFFRDNREAPGINVAINDGGGDCTCENCRALDAPDTDYSRGDGMSERYVYFTNRICEIVGEEFPDKWIVYLAYANASAAPKIVTPHPRLLPVTTTPSAFQRWDEWMQSGARHIGAYVHHLGTFTLTPKTDFHQQAKRIRYMIGSEKLRTYYMECHTQWPHADLIPYITAELVWDPRTDVDALLDEYYTKFYRTAADPMRDYHAVLREGYERWLEDWGRPHWYGKDLSSYAYNKTLEQYRVLSPEEADRAAAALQRAVSAAGNDDLAAQRVAIVNAAFGLQHIAIDRAWAAYRLRDTHPESEEQARSRIADTRLIFQAQREAKQYIDTVLEAPPFDQRLLYRNSSKPLKVYDQLKSGELDSEMRSIISLGVSATEDYLRNALGGEKAAAWWQREAEQEQVPALKTAFVLAAKRALAPPPENLIDDPGFEQFGRELSDGSAETLLVGPQVKQAGVHLTFPDRTPFRCAIATDQVHSGAHSLMLEHCARARLTRHFSAEAETRYRAGLWLRQDEGTASAYEFSVDVRLEDGSYQTLSTLRIPDAPNQWRQFVADVKTPPGTTTLFVRLHVSNQAAGTRCWVDDVFAYP